MRVISLDIETYGSCERDSLNRPLPEATVFDPVRSLSVDNCPLQSQVQTISITEVLCDPPPLEGASIPWISTWEAGPTRVFQASRPDHIEWVRKWLNSSSVIAGFNLLYDLSYLRACTTLDAPLSGRHQLIDGTVLSFLECPGRPEQSLKSLSNLFLRATYASTLAEGRFSSPTDPRLLTYNALDTHYTTLLCAHLARTIRPLDRVPPYTLRYYSDLIWTCLRMAEDGIPLDLRRLYHLHRTLLRFASLAARSVSSTVTLSGTGSANSKRDFVSRLLDEAPAVLSHPLRELTDVRRLTKWSQLNRTLFRQELPPDHPFQGVLATAEFHEHAQKLISSYTHPLLFGARSVPTNLSDVTTPRLPPPVPGEPMPPLPPRGTVGWVHPQWFVTPSAYKDGSGDSGGQIQGRISAKHPAPQTWPSIIKKCLAPPILSFDLSQIELRVAALLSGDAKLCAAYLAGLDLHTDRTLEIFGSGIRDHPRFKAYRQVGKGVNFADLYLSSAATMQAQTFKKTGQFLPLSFYTAIVQSRPTSRPGLWAWQRSLLEEARRTGHLILPITGHIRHFPGDAEQDHLNEIVNFPIQTTASVCFLRLLSRIHHLLPPLYTKRRHIRLCTSVHDSAFFHLSSPRFVPRLQETIAAAFEWLTTRDYWRLLCDHIGRDIPLAYDLTLPEA